MERLTSIFLYNISDSTKNKRNGCYQIIYAKRKEGQKSLFFVCQKGGKSYGRKEEDVYFYSRDGKSFGDWAYISLQTCKQFWVLSSKASLWKNRHSLRFA